MNRRRWQGVIRLLLIALVTGAFAGPALAQEAEDDGADMPSVSDRQDRLRNMQSPPTADIAVPEGPTGFGVSDETAAAYEATLRAYYDYRQRGYEHRMGVFEWQSFSSKLIFAIVLVLVFLGMYFAAIQFHVGLRRSGRSGPTDEAEATEFVVSVSELKVRSPVLGVVVLAISLAFFYLYLVYVYPIENVF